MRQIDGIEEEKSFFDKSSQRRKNYNERDSQAKRGPLILIADDQIFLLDTLRMILADMGLESDIALGGLQAIKMVK